MSSFVKLVAEQATFHDKCYLAGVREIVNERLFVFTEIDTRHWRQCKARVKLVCDTILGDSDVSQRAPLDVRLLRVFASPPEISRIEGECARRLAHSMRLRDSVGPRLLGGLRSPTVGLCPRRRRHVALCSVPVAAGVQIRFLESLFSPRSNIRIKSSSLDQRPVTRN